MSAITVVEANVVKYEILSRVGRLVKDRKIWIVSMTLKILSKGKGVIS